MSAWLMVLNSVYRTMLPMGQEEGAPWSSPAFTHPGKLVLMLGQSITSNTTCLDQGTCLRDE